MTLADRIVVMNKGRLEQVGKPLDLYYAPANLFRRRLQSARLRLNFFEAKVESVEAARARDGAGLRNSICRPTSLKVATR